MGKHSRKLFNKRATSRENVERIKGSDGRDEQIADVRGGNLNDNAITRRVVNQGAIGFDEIGIGEVGGNRIFNGGVGSNQIQSRAVGFGQLADGGVGPQKLDRAYLTPSQGDSTYAFKSHSHSASTALRDTPYEHSHSISSTTFIKQPRAERMRMLNDRLDLEELLYSGRLHPDDAIVARNTLNLLTLLMDYRSLNAFQRERAFVDPRCSEWTGAYKRVYGVDEYAEDDRKTFLAYGDVRMDPYTGIAPAKASEASASEASASEVQSEVQSPKDPGN